MNIRGILVLVLAVACADRPPAPLASGVSVVTTPEALANLPTIAIGPKPLSVIRASATDDKYDLYNTPGIVRLSTGDLVLAPHNGPIRIFGANGEYRTTVGQKGSGPGEFRQIINLCAIRGDTIVAYDNELSRVSYFVPDGRFIRSIPLGRGIGQSRGGFNESGWFVGTVDAQQSARREKDGKFRDSLSVIALDPATGTRVHLEDMYGPWRTEKGTLPFTPRPLIAVAGRYVAVTSGDDLIVRLYASDSLIREIRVDQPRRKVTDDDLEKVGTSKLGLSDADQAAYEQHMKEARVHAIEFHGQVARLMADSAGNVWILPTFSLLTGTPREWVIFGPDGRPRGRFPEKIDGASVWSVSTETVIIDRFVDGIRTAIEVWPLQPVRPA